MATFNNSVNNLNNSQGVASKPLLAILAIVAIVVFYFYLTAGNNKVESIGDAELKAIRSGDLQTAYNLTSSAFKKQTTPEAFTTFLGQYPILQQYTSVTFSQKDIGKATAAIGGVIVGGDGHQMQIQFHFVKEDKAWHIQGISLAPLGSAEPKMTTDNSGATVKNMLISDVADGEGYVTKGKGAVDKLSAKIYVTAQVTTSKAGGQVEATLTQLSNGQKFGPTLDDINQAGNILKAFAFTKVTDAWAVGEYEATIKLSSGDSKSVKFEVK